MGDAAEEMEAVLSGKAWDVGGSAEPPIPVRLGSSVCYVVLAVLFNAEDAVLLVQESKPRCRGLWYLPAGRVEPHESLAAALRREVREEAGLQCEPLTLLALEERGPMWVRFVFLARHTGGTLKTLRDADADSLQAVWWHGDPRALPLRAPDILPLLDLASRYRRSPPPAPPHPPAGAAVLPALPAAPRRLPLRSRGGPLGAAELRRPPPPPGGAVDRPPPAKPPLPPPPGSAAPAGLHAGGPPPRARWAAGAAARRRGARGGGRDLF